MYRITPKLAKEIIEKSNSSEIPGWEKNVSEPFTPQNLHTIGIIEPGQAIGTEFDYIVETDHDVTDPFLGQSVPAVVDGCWIYKKNELKPVTEKLEIPKELVDPNCQNPDEKLDITDCVVELPSSIEKQTCPLINDLKRLLQLEPNLKKCLKKEK